MDLQPSIEKIDYKAIIDALRQTADGVPVTPETVLFFWVDEAGYVVSPGRAGNKVALIETIPATFDTTEATGGEYPHGVDVGDCYSTRDTATTIPVTWTGCDADSIQSGVEYEVGNIRICLRKRTDHLGDIHSVDIWYYGKKLDIPDPVPFTEAQEAAKISLDRELVKVKR